MRRFKILSLAAILATMFLPVSSSTLAQSISKGTDTAEDRAERALEAQNTQGASGRADDDNDIDEDTDSDGDDSEDRLETGKSMSEEHRSRVAEVVLGLTELAGKDKNIGEEVREVAREQEESSARAEEAIKKVESREKWKTFLFGTDYKNIGALRSELVTSENHIERLTKARERAANDLVKNELDAEITALKEANAAAKAFIEENESKLSLLGWLVRLLNNQ